jgi:hypothetical protein
VIDKLHAEAKISARPICCTHHATFQSQGASRLQPENKAYPHRPRKRRMR